jgi:hypothetical protein
MKIWNTKLESDIRNLIIVEDAFDLIRSGAPTDEYDLEINEIISLISEEPKINEKKIYNIVHNTFKNYFNTDSKYLKNRYKIISEEIYQFLLEYHVK